MIFIVIALIVGIGSGFYQHFHYYEDFKSSALAALGCSLVGIVIALALTTFASLVVSCCDVFYYTPISEDELVPIANEYYMTIGKGEGTTSKSYRVLVKDSGDSFHEELLIDGEFSFDFDDDAQPTLASYKPHFRYSWFKLFSFNLAGKYYIITLPADSIYTNINLEVLHE